MGASNRHGGMKLPRRVKVLFMKQAGRHDVFRHYFGVKKSTIEEGAHGGAPAASAPASEPAKS
jgi:hypothetical protein